MPNIDKVIQGIERCLVCSSSVLASAEAQKAYLDCEYTVDLYCGQKKLLRHTLDVLKEQRKTGEWIEKEDYNLDTYYDCSICGESWTTIDGTPWQNGMNYCPHCGTKMIFKKEQDEHTDVSSRQD